MININSIVSVKKVPIAGKKTMTKGKDKQCTIQSEEREKVSLSKSVVLFIHKKIKILRIVVMSRFYKFHELIIQHQKH